jgi:hypothetical protein
MATTTTDPPTGPQAVPLPQKRPVGRPRKVNGAAESGPSITGQTEDSFWEWVDSIPKDDWQYLIFYVWRTAPLVDLSGGGKPITVEKITRPFDANEIFKAHGSGGYRFDVARIPADGGRQTRIKQSFQTLIDIRFPPRIALGTWIDDPRNSDWLWAKPALIEEAGRLASASQPQQQSATSAVVDALDVVAKIKEISGGDADPGMTGIVLQMLKSDREAMRDYNDPAKQLNTLKNLMEVAGSGSKGQDSTLTLIVQMLQEQNRELRQEMRDMRSAPPPDPLSTLKSTMEVFGGMLSQFGINPGAMIGGKGKGEGVAEVVGDVLGKVVDKASDFIPVIAEAYKHGKDRDLAIAMQGGQQAQQQQRRPWEFQPPGVAAAQPISQPVAQAAQPIATPPPAPLPNQPMTAQLLFAKYRVLIESVGPALLDHFKNEDGHVFREWLIDRKGHDLWAAFKADATAEMLTEGLMSTPQGKALFHPEEKALAFFTDMLNDEGGDDDDEGEEGDSPIGAEKEN